MIDANGIQITVPAAAIGVIVWKSAEVLLDWWFKKSGVGNGNGTCKASSIVIPVMDTHGRVLGNIETSNREIRDGVKELITVTRERRNR